MIAMMTHDRLLEAVRVFGECTSKSDGDLVGALVAAGFSRRESEILVVLLPMAFGRVALENMGRVEFSETVLAMTRRGKMVEIPLSAMPIYGAALALARQSYSAATGIVSREQFSAVADRSAEIDALEFTEYTGQIIFDNVVYGRGVTKTLLNSPSAEDLGYDRLGVRLLSLAYAWHALLRGWLANR